MKDKQGKSEEMLVIGPPDLERQPRSQPGALSIVPPPATIVDEAVELQEQLQSNPDIEDPVCTEEDDDDNQPTILRATLVPETSPEKIIEAKEVSQNHRWIYIVVLLILCAGAAGVVTGLLLSDGDEESKETDPPTQSPTMPPTGNFDIVAILRELPFRSVNGVIFGYGYDTCQRQSNLDTLVLSCPTALGEYVSQNATCRRQTPSDLECFLDSVQSAVIAFECASDVVSELNPRVEQGIGLASECGEADEKEEDEPTTLVGGKAYQVASLGRFCHSQQQDWKFWNSYGCLNGNVLRIGTNNETIFYPSFDTQIYCVSNNECSTQGCNVQVAPVESSTLEIRRSCFHQHMQEEHPDFSDLLGLLVEKAEEGLLRVEEYAL